MGLFDTNQLTGHVRILTRREKARQTASVPSQGGTPERMKEAAVLVERDEAGNLIVDEDVHLTDERYIIVRIVAPMQFADGEATNIGLTFDLGTLWPDGVPKGISYYLVMNQSGMDVNIVLGGKSIYQPVDTIVKCGCCREASLYTGEAGRILTISDDLMES